MSVYDIMSDMIETCVLTQLLNRNGINLIQYVNGRDVNSSTFNNVDKLVQCRIASERDVTVGHLCKMMPPHQDLTTLLERMPQCLTLYSPNTALISSVSNFVRGTVLEMAIPPLSFFLSVILGGCLLSRMPSDRNERASVGFLWYLLL